MFGLKQYRFGIARLLLGLYITVLVNGIVFRHSHRLADGTIICHAHPYKSSPGTQFPNHAHTRDELIWLDVFANALYATSDLVVWSALAAIVLFVMTGGVTAAPFLLVATQVVFQYRGPPVRLF